MARKAIIPAAILDLMGRSDRHAWTLDELRAELTADFSSVFRAAEKLVADGRIRKLPLHDGRARFELAGAHHDHLHCTGCDELVPIPCLIGHTAQSALEAEMGVAIDGHDLVLSGHCPSCRTAGG